MTKRIRVSGRGKPLKYLVVTDDTYIIYQGMIPLAKEVFIQGLMKKAKFKHPNLWVVEGW